MFSPKTSKYQKIESYVTVMEKRGEYDSNEIEIGDH